MERIAIVGGGAAGFFAAIECAEANPPNEVTVYERGSHFLTKVRISGGGRCNVTHTPALDLRAFSSRYPRGDEVAESLGHTIAPPVPSLFALHIATSWLRELPGVSVPDVELSVPDAK